MQALPCLLVSILFLGHSAWPTQAATDTLVSWTGMDATYNPSLVIYGDMLLSALKRTTFRKLKSKVFWVNHLYVCLGRDGDIPGLRCRAYNPWPEAYMECEFDKRVRGGKVDTSGLGDMKVWVWPGKGVFSIFGRKPERQPDSPYCNTKVVYDQWITQIRPEATAGDWRLQQPLRLYIAGNYEYPKDADFVMEKNWMPWVYKHANGSDTLYVTHMVNPHRILECRPSGACEVAYETTNSQRLFGPFTNHSVHGGPPVVHVPATLSGNGKPYYLGIMHHIEWVNRVSSRTSSKSAKTAKLKAYKLYRHFAYMFSPEPPFAITDVSDELELEWFSNRNHPTKAYIAYVAGLYLTDNGTVYISYGAGDREARIRSMPLRELEAKFTGRIAFIEHNKIQAIGSTSSGDGRT